jgi:zinc transporter ZupT
MVSNGIKKCQIVTYMVTLGLVTPIGIIIGIVLTSSASSETLVVGVMQVSGVCPY